MTYQKPYVLVRGKNHPERCVPLTSTGLGVGRLPENEICLEDPACSRRHCRIENAGRETFRVIDLASANGTFVNNARIHEHTLNAGDCIRIGQVEMLFIDPRHERSLDPPLPAPQNHAPPQHPPPSDAVYLLQQMGRLLNSRSALQDILESALGLLTEHFKAHRACLCRWDETSNAWRIEARQIQDPVVELACPTIPSSIAGRARDERKGVLTFDAALDPRFAGEVSVQQAAVRSALCAPLEVNGHFYGVIYLDHLGSGEHFESHDLDLVATTAHILGACIGQQQLRKDLQQQAMLRTNLERFHAPDVVRTIAHKTAETGKLHREVVRCTATILFSDIKGFTSMSEKLAPEEVALLLNNYLSRMTQILFMHGGTVNKFIGDSVMAIFGAPTSHGAAQDAASAVRAALQMQRGLGDFLAQIAQHKRFQMRIGINTGEVVAGYIGAEGHMEYTVLGDNVNLASRLESRCNPGSILVGESTQGLTQGLFQFGPRTEAEVKGKEKPVAMYEVLG